MKRTAITLLLLGALSGCAQLGYLWQSVAGHFELLRAARPLDDWLADPHADAGLKARLELTRRLRAFAVSQLRLPDNASYQRYADIGRTSVVWNVVAAPELSLEAKTWCFPVAGCVAYRGYFLEADARAEAELLRQQGLEVSVYGVPAYSTLGWMNWAGGDPLLSTFVSKSESELARLLFHELAHQVAYAKDDTTFNESFATAVESMGLRQWQASQTLGQDTRQASAQDVLAQARRTGFRALTRATRERLLNLYAAPADADRDALRRAKSEVMARMRQDYAALRASWLTQIDEAPGAALQMVRPANISGYDRWVREANNASIASLASYDDLALAFERLFEREGADWARFYDAVRALAAGPKNLRDDTMRALQQENTGG